MASSVVPTTAQASTHTPIALSTGRTILHRREPNGSQFAYPAGDEDGAMTNGEWSEYCAIIAAGTRRVYYVRYIGSNLVVPIAAMTAAKARIEFTSRFGGAACYIRCHRNANGYTVVDSPV